MAKFKARARALDMLGRQQIAGIPTAISELFKNAHDAYAEVVEVDYYRSDGLFVLSDDGLGMTEHDFTDRWLTLGTESKLEGIKGLEPPPKDPRKIERQILGEKGIGRLAIASIGPQVLVLSRAKRENKLHNLIVSFINWSLFELPGVDLDEVVVPLAVFDGGKLPGGNDINDLVNDVISNIKELKAEGKISQKDERGLLSQLNKFDVNPQEIDEYLESPSLKDGSGTQFYIMPADDLLQSDLEVDRYVDKAPPLIKMLIGFTNTMTPDAPEAKIVTRFRDHKTDESYEELIGPSEFVTPEEFEKADHHFQGKFDEYGQFKGSVSVYGKKVKNHIIPWGKAQGNKTLCGPFKINVAYVQGSLSKTMLPVEEHAIMKAKLDKIGGLYIYRDGIRILPYGDSDYDFLEIERRRSKHAGYYYFSYRRMVGVIEVSRKNNPNLVEKAGREGFIQNKAYRQFKDILENFFLQLAADFFREKGENLAQYVERSAELKALYDARKEREEQAMIRRQKFESMLEVFFDDLANGKPQEYVSDLLESTKNKFVCIARIDDPDRGVKEFLDAEYEARARLEEVRNKYKVPRLRGFAMYARHKQDYALCLAKYEKLEKDVFRPAEIKIEKIIGETFKDSNFAIDRRRRLERALQDVIDEAKKATRKESKETMELAKDVNKKIIGLTRELIEETNHKINQVLSDFESTDVSEMSDAALVSKRSELEGAIISEVERNKKTLEDIQEQLANITWIPDESGEMITSIDITEAIEGELLELREKADSDLELNQLGMAIGVIHHEFSGTVKSIRESIRELKAWSDVNDAIFPVYNNIRSNFEHLDGYLTLFTPLNRRLYRKEIEISGNSIKKFLEDIFRERMRRHEVELFTTPKFVKKKIIGYPSTFYPVFVNLLDNAIFWLEDIHENRKIVLDADEKGFFISNNGPAITKRDREIIFDYGFSRKPNGRGIGLYISREVLDKIGYRIYVTDPVLNEGVTFRIEQSEKINRGA